MGIDRHHLLECILWPNGDGTFRKIVNTQKRLKELGAYDDHKMTISIEHGTHSSMHMKFKKGTEYGQEGEKNPMYGKDRSGSNNPRWTGDNVSITGAYQRALKMYKTGKITEEEFQPYRDSWNEYFRSKRAKKKQSGVQSSENH